MLDDFMVRAALAAAGVALAAGPLGCFVVWRRMAYFGDTISHAAILGVALSLLFDMSISVGVLVAAVAVALLVSRLSGRSLASDTLLGVAAHGALALGLVALSFMPGVRVDLMGYLFGDVLAVGKTDVVLIWLGALTVCVGVGWRWKNLLLATLNPDLAASHNVDHRHERALLMIAIALLVAVAIKVVGALLITALLIIPAATARGFARIPETMVLLSVLAGWIASIGGLGLSLYADTPAGASIVTGAVALFLAGSAVQKVLRK